MRARKRKGLSVGDCTFGFFFICFTFFRTHHTHTQHTHATHSRTTLTHHTHAPQFLAFIILTFFYFYSSLPATRKSVIRQGVTPRLLLLHPRRLELLPPLLEVRHLHLADEAILRRLVIQNRKLQSPNRKKAPPLAGDAEGAGNPKLERGHGSAVATSRGSATKGRQRD